MFGRIDKATGRFIPPPEPSCHGRPAERLTLTGEAPGPAGSPQRQRLTFFDDKEGAGRQLWETSDDEGKSWQVVFDGLYRGK